MVIKKNIEWLS